MRKILIVDDEEMNQFFLRKLVSQNNIEVHTAANGEVAVELAKENNFSMIFMDIFMPLLDGIGALAQIRMHEQDSKHRSVIVAVTSSSGSIEAKYKNADFDEWLFNPIALTAVQDLLKKYQLSYF